MRAAALVPLVLFAAGVGLLVATMLRGGGTPTSAMVGLALSASSWALALGLAALLAGLLSLPFLWPGAFRELEEVPPPAAEASDPEGESVAAVIIGPLPVFVGAWRNARTPLRSGALIGASVAVLALVLLVLAT